jgi:hypothetical protein
MDLEVLVVLIIKVLKQDLSRLVKEIKLVVLHGEVSNTYIST